MPRPAKSARLWLRRERIDKKTGKRIANSQWFIADSGERHPTGCSASEIERAEEKLAAYIASKYAPERRVRDIETIDVADVLAIYDADKREGMANQEKHDERIERLASWWGGKMLSDVTGVTCREYASWRAGEEQKARAQAAKRRAARGLAPAALKPITNGGARRDLEDLRAAINHHSKEGLHRGIVGVWLPAKGAAKERWLTRDEAARLLWVCWRSREMQRRKHDGNKTAPKVPTERYPLRHIARFILLGLYTGTRAAAIAAAAPERGDGKAYVDLDRGIFYRLAGGKRATAKRQTPVPLPPNLLGHLRRWARPAVDKKTGEKKPPAHFVEWNGKPIASVKTGFARAAKLAGLGEDVTPHTLRHTAATWLMQNGVPIWEAAGFLGMSPELVEKTYGHHHPDHLKAASRGFRPKRNGGDNGGGGKGEKS